MCTWNLLEHFYKIKVDKEKGTLSLNFNNSWKAMVQFSLTLLFIENGNKVVIMQGKYKFVTSVRIDQNFNSLAIDIKPDAWIEKLYVPQSYRPIYALSTYSNKKVLDTLQKISIALSINFKKKHYYMQSYSNKKQYKII